MLKSIVTSPKTSIIGAITAIVTLLQLFGVIHLTAEQIAAIGTAAVAIIGLLAKDGDRGTSSEPTDQNK